jgi:hypothetical protein
MKIQTMNYAQGRANPADLTWEFILKLFFLTAATCFLFVPNAVFAACTGASPNWSSSVDYNSLTSCVNNAAAGDTINVSAGTATYTSGITISKPVSIIGAGPTSTIINGSAATVLVVNMPSAGKVRISNIGFTGSGGTTQSEDVLINLRGTLDYVRLDHLKFTNIQRQAIYIGLWDRIPVSPKVLIDHIDYSSTLSTGYQQFIKTLGNNNTWKLADRYGTDDFVFIEDSKFSWSTADVNSAVTDTEHGVRLVVRNNTITNGGVQVHDTGSTPAAKGQRVTEVYNNTFNCTSAAVCSSITAIGIRGGGWMIYNNTISTNYGVMVWPQIYRATVGAGYLGKMCNGTAVSACDTPTYYHCSGGDHAACGYSGDSACSGKGSCIITATSQSDCPVGSTFLAKLDNVDGGNDPSGYPCRHQTGWGQESSDGKTEQPSPVYWYNNKNQNGTIITPLSDDKSFKLNRDYCNHDASTACGTKAGWTYTTYQYPHPLQAGSVGSPPSVLPPANLRVTP